MTPINLSVKRGPFQLTFGKPHPKMPYRLYVVAGSAAVVVARDAVFSWYMPWRKSYDRRVRRFYAWDIRKMREAGFRCGRD